MFTFNQGLALCSLLASVQAYPSFGSMPSTSRPRLKPFNFDTNLVEGDSVRVFCTLQHGTQPVSFQWYKDDRQLTASSKDRVSIQNHGDYSSLVIEKVSRNFDVGNYTCHASNSYGNDATSSLLIVQEPPYFLEEPRDISIGLHKSTFVVCRASQSNSKPIITWNRILPPDSDAIDSNARFLNPALIDKDTRRKTIFTGSQLHLASVRLEDAGVYECVAENPHNGLTISHTFTLTVNVPPFFENKNDIVEVKRGETARIVCEARGAKPMSVTWLKQNGRTLDFEPIAIEALSRFTQFEKNFDSLFDGSSSSSKVLLYVNNNQTIFELHIASVVGGDSGQYGCRVRNEFGEDTRRINLFVQDVPAAVRLFRIDQIWSREVSVSWQSPEAMGNSPISQYVLQYWREVRITPAPSTVVSYATSNQTDGSFVGGHRLHEIEIASTETYAIVRDLTPGTAYVLRVLAVNGFGRGAVSPSMRVITAEEAPSAPPIDIHVEPLDTSSFVIRWKAPPKGYWLGHLKGYYLGYRVVGLDVDDNNDNDNEVKSAGGGGGGGNNVDVNYSFKEIPFGDRALEKYQEEFVLTGLNRATIYGIVIRAFNGVGEGPNSQEMLATTATNDAPSKPTIWLSEVKDNSIAIKYENKDSKTPITHDYVYYKEDKKSNWIERLFVRPNKDGEAGNEGVHELGGLRRGTNYQLYMKSRGYKTPLSQSSEIINARTQGEATISLDTALSIASASAAIPTIYSPSLVQPTSSYDSQSVPPYLRANFILPIAIAVVVIVVACVGAYVYIRVDDRKANVRAIKAAGRLYAGQMMPGGSGVPIGMNKQYQYTPSLMNNSQTSSMNTSGSSCNQSMVSEEGSLSFRFSDTGCDKNRPLLSRAPGQPMAMWSQQQGPIAEEDEIESNAYETLPFQKNGLLQSTPMQSFATPHQVNATISSNNSNGSIRSPAFPPPPPPLPEANYANGRSPQRAGVVSARNSGVGFCHVDVHHVQSSNNSEANNSDCYDEFHFFAPGPQPV